MNKVYNIIFKQFVRRVEFLTRLHVKLKKEHYTRQIALNVDDINFLF